MTHSISVLSVTCLALLCCRSQPSPRTRSPQSEMNARMAAASDLLDAMGGRKSVMEQIDRVIPTQMQALQSQFPSMTADTRRIIEKSMRNEMARRRQPTAHPNGQRLGAPLYRRRNARDLRLPPLARRPTPARPARRPPARNLRDRPQLGRRHRTAHLKRTSSGKLTKPARAGELKLKPSERATRARSSRRALAFPRSRGYLRPASPPGESSP